MQITFLNVAGTVLFVRDDMEQGNWTQEEYTVNATFPYISGKVITRGMRISFRDPATNNLEFFEIRNVTTIEPEHYQQIIAEHIAVSELSDEHCNTQEITDKTPAQALGTVLTGTLWSVGNTTVTDTNSVDIARGSVWQAVNSIAQNWNAYITPRITVNTAGSITGRYLDIAPAQGVWRGVRLSVNKNMVDSSVVYDDSEVSTAMYGYGGMIDVEQSTTPDTQEELTFADVIWTATDDHPAKPDGQTYLEWPAKTALYGRNGRPRFGFYQNADITDDETLLEKTWEVLKRTSDPKINITGTVADLYRLGYKDQPLRLHDTVIVDIEPTGEHFSLQIIKLDVDLIDPTATRPEIGAYIPNIIYINRDTNEKATGGGGGGGRGKTNEEEETYNTYSGFEKLTDEYGSMISMVVGKRDGDNYIKAGEIGLAINASTGETKAWIDADHINISATQDVYALAGDLEHDANGNLIIKSAGGMYVQRTEHGITAQFGVFDNGNLDGGIIVDKVNDSTNTYITGDHINISGTSTVQTLAGEMEVDANGNLIIKDGAGFKARVGQAEFGIYNENNLNAGVIVGKINDSTGQTFAAVKADHINISGTSTAHMLSGSIVYDENGNLVLKQSSGGGVVVERTEGQTTSTFGVWDRGNLTGGVMVQQINGSTGTYITGDHINISGTSTVHTLAGQIEADDTGKLIVKSAGGMYVQRTESGITAEFGVWDDGNLTAGVIATIVNGVSSTYISGDKIYIGNKSATTVIDGKASISDLNTTNATISNLTSGATTAASLKTNLLSASSGFTYQGHAVSFHTITIGETTYHLLGY